jgi:hypothetical protein
VTSGANRPPVETAYTSMPDPNRPDDGAEAIAVAEQVVAGTDSIAVPIDLVNEPTPADRVPEEALWKRIRMMTVAEKVKLALKGNKDARVILLRDANRIIPRLVLQNPRISEDEILMLSKDRNTDVEVLRIIAESREWTKTYAVRAALVENARTPVVAALKLLVTLAEREISRLAKSKNVPSIIAMQARRISAQGQRR